MVVVGGVTVEHPSCTGKARIIQKYLGKWTLKDMFILVHKFLKSKLKRGLPTFMNNVSWKSDDIQELLKYIQFFQIKFMCNLHW